MIFLQMESKLSNTDKKRVGTLIRTIFENKPNLFTFHESIFVNPKTFCRSLYCNSVSQCNNFSSSFIDI